MHTSLLCGDVCVGWSSVTSSYMKTAHIKVCGLSWVTGSGFEEKKERHIWSCWVFQMYFFFFFFFFLNAQVKGHPVAFRAARSITQQSKSQNGSSQYANCKKLHFDNGKMWQNCIIMRYRGAADTTGPTNSGSSDVSHVNYNSKICQK